MKNFNKMSAQHKFPTLCKGLFLKVACKFLCLLKDIPLSFLCHTHFIGKVSNDYSTEKELKPIKTKGLLKLVIPFND